MEVLLGTATISDLIKRGDFSSIKEIMEKSKALGMQTFDQALFDLVVEGSIQEEEAIKNADSANNLRLKLKLHRDGPGTRPTAAPTRPRADAPGHPDPGRRQLGPGLKLEELPEDEPPPEDPGKHY